MDTTVKLNDFSSLCTTSRAGLNSYPLTAAPDFNAIYIYDVVNGIEDVASVFMSNIQSIFAKSEDDMFRQRIVVEDEAFYKFKNHLESTEVYQNTGLEKLFKKFL
jgi:hypothetical protein